MFLLKRKRLIRKKQVLGIKANIHQFVLLSLSTLFVGSMLGLERVIVPLLGKQYFHLQGALLILSFIVAFGASKAILNLLAGRLSDRLGRKAVLISGWVIGLPVPLLLLYAPSWNIVILANLLLGANQALAWTMTVTSQIDLVTQHERGLAMGINEATGYLGVALGTYLTSILARGVSHRPAPFFFGLVMAIIGLLLSFLIRETHTPQPKTVGGAHRATATIFWETTWKNPTLSTLSMAGLANKLADTLIWGLLPLYLIAQGFTLAQIGLISGLYAMVWGLGQFGTGLISDRIGRKPPIVVGMLMLGSGILFLPVGHSLDQLGFIATIMGVGMALLYPNLNASVSDIAPLSERGAILGTYRLWRDGGYAIGGLSIGFLSDYLGYQTSILIIGALVLFVSVLLIFRMKETLASKI